MNSFNSVKDFAHNIKISSTNLTVWVIGGKWPRRIKNGFFIHIDLLFRNERILGHTFKQLCVPQSRQNVILDPAHNGVGAHMGIKRTRERILFSFTWPGLRADVRKYIQTCQTCQKHARVTCQDRIPIKAIEFDAKPFRVWFIDILVRYSKITLNLSTRWWWLILRPDFHSLKQFVLQMRKMLCRFRCLAVYGCWCNFHQWA